MSYLCTKCESTVIPSDEPEDGWEEHTNSVKLACTQCYEKTIHIPGPKGYVRNN